jgi:hypothetical protein
MRSRAEIPPSTVEPLYPARPPRPSPEPQGKERHPPPGPEDEREAAESARNRRIPCTDW